MTSRLNAKEAAALTANRAKELEAQAKQEEMELRLRAAQARKFSRLWNSQANILIKSALNRKTFSNIKGTLIGADRLIRSGFEIYYVDNGLFLERQKQMRLEKDREIDEFLKLVEGNARFVGMTVTKENALKQIRAKINEYQDEISHEKSSCDQLFNFIFDGKLFLFKPIDSLRPITQRIQDALHRYEKLARNLPEDEFSDDKIESDDDSIEKESDIIFLIPEEFWRYLTRKDCRESMELVRVGDFFQVQWHTKEDSKDWLFDELISASALAWLAGDDGQRLIDLIELKIRTAIDSASTRVRLDATGNGHSWQCDFDGAPATQIPHPDHLSQILKTMDYAVKSKATGCGGVSIEISW